MNLRVWRLRSHLSALLVLTVLASIGIVGTVSLMVRIPQIEREHRGVVADDVAELTSRVETLLGLLTARLDLLSDALQVLPLSQANELMDRATGGRQAFGAIYLATNQGTVVAAGVAPELRLHRDDLLGSDLSANPLHRAALSSRRIAWGDKYLSALSGAVTVGVAYPVGASHILIAEVPLTYLLGAVRLAAGTRQSTIWLVDRAGEILADTEGGRRVGTVNLLNSPVMPVAGSGQHLPDAVTFDGRHYHPAAAQSKSLGWYFIGGIPVGLENDRIRSAVLFVAAGFVGSLLVGLLLAPLWATWLVQPLRDIVRRAGHISEGLALEARPRGSIEEFNHLADDLDHMAISLKEREQRALAIFNASPVPMTVTDLNRESVFIDVNEAWCATFGYQRGQVLGRTGIDIGLQASVQIRMDAIKSMQEGSASVEGTLYRADRVPVLCQIYCRLLQSGDARLMVWATIDIGDLRRTTTELQELNAELEARVARRTEALDGLNNKLSGVVAHLRETQTELVRSAKMAALGGLVAGVAHELNTPLGNGLMAVTALNDEARQFKVSMQSGLRRSALEDLLASVEQGTGIATRNLQRAAELVTSFKQVAVDQSSAQRRSFELGEVVGEMLVTLHPTLSRTPYKVTVNVPTGLRLDSYPGALGQVVVNLINNAVLHGFDGRTHGIIRITGERGETGEPGEIVLRVADDGKGIPEALLSRVFDPFVTTRMGQGGTGLGLHISYNAVVNMLGGSITVFSEPGQGAMFTVRLPEVAPEGPGASTR